MLAMSKAAATRIENALKDGLKNRNLKVRRRRNFKKRGRPKAAAAAGPLRKLVDDHDAITVPIPSLVVSKELQANPPLNPTSSPYVARPTDMPETIAATETVFVPLFSQRMHPETPRGDCFAGWLKMEHKIC